MAKWKVAPGSVNNTLSGTFEYDSGSATGESIWKIHQDEKPFLEEAKRERDNGTRHTHNNHKKFATIPDIVAIEITQKYGIDIHDPLIMHDKNKMRRFKQIVMNDYPYLVINKA